MKYLIITFCLIVIWFNMFAQVDFRSMMLSPNANFYNIQQAAINYYLTDSTDESEGGGYQAYKRWETFWKTRVDKIGETPGSFQYAYDALNQFFQSPVCTNTDASDWQNLGPLTQSGPNSYPDMGRVISLAVDPLNTNIVYAGTDASGLWVADVSQTPIQWTSLTDNLKLPGLGVNDISIVHSNIILPATLYIATGISTGLRGGYGIGILKSFDGGITWSQISPVSPSTYNVSSKILVDPTNENIIYSLIRDAVYKSLDAGETWDMVFQLPNSAGQDPYSGGIARHLADIAILPNDPNTIFVSSDDAEAAVLEGACGTLSPLIPSDGNDGSIIYRTIDGGSNWYPILLDGPTGTKSPLIGLATTLDDPDVFYVLHRKYYNFNCGSSIPTYSSVTELQKIDKYGNILSTINPSSGIGFGTLRPGFAISQNNKLIIYTTTQYFITKSINGGVSFLEQNTNMHVDNRTIFIAKNGTNDIVLLGNDGGITMGINGSNWTNINGTGLSITQFYGIGSSEVIPDLIAGGTQDNDIYVYRSGNWWNNVNRDAANIEFDKNNGNVMFATKFCCGFNPPDVYRYAYNGINWSYSSSHPSNIGNNLIPIQIANDNDLYAAYENVYKTPTTGFTWQKISDFQTNFGVSADAKLVALAVAPSNPLVIYTSYPGPCWCWPSNGSSFHYLFKTTNGGGLNLNDWEDLTPYLFNDVPKVPWDLPIADIVVNSNNTDEVWVSLGGFANDGSTNLYNGIFRVIKSTDGGHHWTDYSIGLPQFPVNTIVHDDGYDGVYVGTDVGVFYTNKDIYLTQGWVCFSNDLPVSIITDLEINYCQGKLRASTYGRGLWESSLMSATISSTTQWSNSRNLSSDLIIKQGTTLTISGNTTIITVSKDKKIVVEPGATLIVNGAKITSNTTCGNNLWQGIEVWGNSSLNQFTESNQGVVQLINGATIENAVQAIRTVKINADNTVNLAYTGGIVKADGANFINCTSGIRFDMYHNILNGTVRQNKSYVRNCKFETNNLALSSAQNPGYYIFLSNVEGFIFTGNTIKNENTTVTDVTKRGYGIYSVNANFTAQSIVNGAGVTIPNKFENLYYGIYATSTNPLKTFACSGNEFTDNYRGIYSGGINNASIILNKINVGQGDNINVVAYGLYYDRGTGFTIEGNEYTSASSSSRGSIINGSGSNANTLYRNKYSNIRVGISAQSNPNINNNGLTIKCNKLINNNQAIDIAITSGTIHNPQGNCTDNKSPANNMFIHPAGVNTSNLFLNSGVIPFTYYYSPASDFITYPVNFTNGINVLPCTNYTFNETTDCPSTLGGSGTSPIALTARIANINTQLTTLTNKIDGGNTQTLLNKINSNMSPGQLKNALLAPGPYLSDVVLIAAINRVNPLPPGILKEIIVPNSPLTTNVMTVLNTKNLPAGIKADIQAVQTGTSAMAILEQQIAELKQQKDLSTAELMRYYLNDSIIKIDSAIGFLTTQSDINSRQQLVQAYLLKGDCGNATTLINQLPQQTSDDTTFKQFYAIMATLCTQGKTVYDLTPSQLQTINTIVTSNTTVSTAAKAVLTTVNGTYFPEIIEELIVPDDQTLRGYLFNNPSCNNSVTEPVPNDTIVLLDSSLTVVNLPSSVITDATGYFKFNFNDLIYLDQTAKYTFGTASGAVIQDTIFKTIQQWITTSPVNLNLKKLKAGFTNDTVKCFNDTVHFTNKTMYGKKPYTYSWSFAFHAGSTQENPIYKYASAGIYNTSLIATDALGCKDTAIKQIIIPACPSIYGFINEHADCGGMPVFGDTIIIKDNSGNIVSTVTPVITNSNGEFNFNLNEIQLLDTSALYTLATKSGFELQDISAKTILQWKTESPMNINLSNVNQEWVNRYSYVDSLYNNPTAIDLQGNVYIGGTTEAIETGYDYTVIKYSPDGLKLWESRYDGGTSQNDVLSALTVDSAGNSYVTGYAYQNNDFYNMVTLKYNTEGTLSWISSLPQNSKGNAIITDIENNTYVTGFAERSGTTITDLIITKYDRLGNSLWSHDFQGATNYSFGTNLLIRPDNSILVCGSFSSHIIVQKFTTSGTLLWSHLYTSGNIPVNVKIADDAVGNIYLLSESMLIKTDVYGILLWSVNLPAPYLISSFKITPTGEIYLTYQRSGNMVLSKYDTDGNELWSNTYDGPVHAVDYPTGIVLDNNENVYLTGLSQQRIGKTGADYITFKYDKDGVLQWQAIYNSVYNHVDGPRDIAISPNTNIYVTGQSYNGHNYDIATVKYSQCYFSANSLRYSNPTNNTESFDNETQILNPNSHLAYRQAGILNQTEYVNMFPNPNDGNFYFNYSLPENEKCQFTVFDPTSKKVYSIEIKGGKNTVIVNHNNFSNGVYYYQVTAGTRLIKTERLVIAK